MSEAFGGECLPGFLAEAQEFGDIRSGDKCFGACSCEDSAFDIVVGIDLFDDFPQLADHVLVEGVEFVRPVDGDGKNVVGEIGVKRLIHNMSIL